MLVDIVDKVADLGLGELRVRAYALALNPHLVVNKRREQINGDFLQNLVVLNQLCEVVTVHFRHLDIAYQAGNLVENIAAERFQKSSHPFLFLIAKLYGCNPVVVAHFSDGV